MAIRTIEYTVTKDGITPQSQQFGGVMGDHKATELLFTLDEELFESILSESNGNRVVYRFDGYDGSGWMDSTVPQELTEKPCSYMLEEWITRHGGNIKIFLVITEIINDSTEMELYSFPAVLKLKSRPEGLQVEGDSRESLSALVEVSKSAAESAVSSAASALESQLKTEESKVALEQGSQFVFLGGNSKGSVDINLVVDDNLSSTSSNPVSNKAIVKRLNEIYSQLLLAAHPIGSYYWSDDSTDPSLIFGGKWEQVKDRFVLAAGDSYTAGETGGEAEHKLTKEELPNYTLPITLFGSNKGIGDWTMLQRGYSEQPSPDITSGGALIVNSGGSDIPHNNMPPYIVAYCFKRIG